MKPKTLAQLKAEFIIDPEAELSRFVNEWADERKHPEAFTRNGFHSDFGAGYAKACSDILVKMQELGLFKEY